MSRQWRLIVYDGRGHEAALHRMGCKESKKADQYVAFYSLDGTPLLKRNIETLKKLGLHGIAKKVEARPPVHRKPLRINGSDGRATLPRGSATVLPFKVAVAAKMSRQLSHEERRQAELMAQRDAYARAQKALRLARGEE
jgi:hypothetical protein